MNLSTPDARRAAAFAAIIAGCGIMTGFAAVGVYLVRANAGLSFWLALAAHGQVLIGLSCLGALLVRRTIKATRDGLEISDTGSDDTIHDGDQITVKKDATT
jgi:hypothetical protein